MRTTGAGHALAVDELEPIGLFELELAGPECRPVDVNSDVPFRRVRVFVRLHGAPVGVLDADVGSTGIECDALAARARRELRAAVDAHLAHDGLPAGTDPSQCSTTPTCVSERAAFAATAPFATVVIATRERPESLASTLDDVLAQEYPGFEVVVVDNAPTGDATRAVVERFAGRSTSVRYVLEPLPGLAVAHNRGLAEARGQFVAFTDDDVIVDRLWLLELARGFELADDVACVTGLILPAELRTPAQIWLEDWVRVNKGYEPKLFDRGSNRPEGRLFPYAAGMFGSGASMAFRTDALRALGGFDPATGTGTRARGGDDLAAFFSVVAAGHTLAYQPTAIVRHAYRRDLESLRKQMFDYGAGLGAYLTKIVVDRPGRLLDISWRVPFGVAHALRSRPSGRNGSAAPVVGLARRERLGMLAGPAGYVLERRRRRALYAPVVGGGGA